MEESILKTVRPACDISPDCADFDDVIIPIINMTFAYIYRMADLKTDHMFRINDETEKWTDVMPYDDNGLLDCVKAYVCKKTKMLFDPPASSTLQEAIKSQLNELEWNIQQSNNLFSAGSDNK